MAKILIVEDNEMNMLLFSDLLKTQGYDIVPCSDGAEAQQAVERERPDLVLMDIQLPGMSGVDITKAIRRTPSIADTRIIAVSAFALPGDAEKMLAEGFDAYLSKPIAIPQFFETVKKELAAA